MGVEYVCFYLLILKYLCCLFRSTLAVINAMLTSLEKSKSSLNQLADYGDISVVSEPEKPSILEGHIPLWERNVSSPSKTITQFTMGSFSPDPRKFASSRGHQTENSRVDKSRSMSSSRIPVNRYDEEESFANHSVRSGAYSRADFLPLDKQTHALSETHKNAKFYPQ